MNLSFQYPYLFWPLLAMLVLWLILFLRQQRRSGSALGYSLGYELESLPKSRWQRAVRPLKFLRFLTLSAIATAALGPSHPEGKVKNKESGVAMMLAIDTSGSMRALDLDDQKPVPKRRNRLEVVKDVVRTFVLDRPTDAIGLLVFGSEAFTQCPLTLDHQTLEQFTQYIDIGMIGESTAIGSAIGLASKRLEGIEAKSKIIILLTDGENTAGDVGPLQAAEIAKALGIRIYTIGAGTRGTAPVPSKSFFGGTRYQQVEVNIDEQTLQGVAAKTGGRYFRAETAGGLANVYNEIDKLEKTDFDSPTFTQYSPKIALLLALAALLFSIEWGLLNTRLRSVP